MSFNNFSEVKKAGLEEIIQKLDEDYWSTTTYEKLIDAKMAMEIKNELWNMKNSLSEFPSKLRNLLGRLEKLEYAIRESADKNIETNLKLAESNAKYSKALNFLTAGLVLVGLLPYIDPFVKWLVSLFY